jgi:hypothetical protein
MKDIGLLVTTEHRGVFFGYGKPGDASTIRLTNARMVVYWASDVRGVLGLAVTGPCKSCKVGPSVPAVTLLKVTAVVECSNESVKEFEREHWN